MRLGLCSLLFTISLFTLAAYAAVAPPVDGAGYSYNPRDTSCGGFPRLQVETMPGTCLGMVLPRGDLVMPRSILQLRDSDDFLLVDMGGWAPGNGALYLLAKENGIYKTKLIKGELNIPHGLAYSPDGWIYLGESQQISRFKFADGRLSDWQLAVDNLPRFKGHMHPLTQFTFDPKSGDLFVNSGAPSDHCTARQSTDGEYVECPDSEDMGLGAIYRYRASDLKKLPKVRPQFRSLSGQGLRNSMAMLVSGSGFLIQGENSRDFPEMEEPYEEINVIDLKDDGYDYGWPYCYDAHATSPEFMFAQNGGVGLRKRFPAPLNCALKKPDAKSNYKPPHALMPPHVAPLHMAYYNGSMFPELNGKILMSWHGHQPTGQRLVAYDVDKNGLPVVSAPPPSGLSYKVNQRSGCPSVKPFAPRGGLDQVAAYSEVISGWDARRGVRPKGAPVGFSVARDGSIFIVEDRAGRDVVRLAKTDERGTAGCVEPAGEALDPRIELLAWRNAINGDALAKVGFQNIEKQVIEKYCASCHGKFKETDIADDAYSRLDFLVKNEWLTPGRPLESKLYGAISGSREYPPMPPGGSPQFAGTSEGEQILKLVENWISALPADVESRHTKIVLGSSRKIRNIAGAAGSVECGQIQAGDAVYVDPRAETRPVRDGWLWSKIYLLPKDSRLYRGRCSASDGVYFIALKKI